MPDANRLFTIQCYVVINRFNYQQCFTTITYGTLEIRQLRYPYSRFVVFVGTCMTKKYNN